MKTPLRSGKSVASPSLAPCLRIMVMGVLVPAIASSFPAVFTTLPVAHAYNVTAMSSPGHLEPHRGPLRDYMNELAAHSPDITGYDMMGMHLAAAGTLGAEAALMSVSGAVRHLLHPGSHKLKLVAMCSRCSMFASVGNWRMGHCKKSGKLFNCFKRKGKGNPVQVTGILLLRRRLRQAEGVLPPLPPLDPQNLAGTAPFVACLTNDDCALPSADFAALNGAPPVSLSGNIAGRCQRPAFVNDPSGEFFDFPGICVCTFVDPATPPQIVTRAETIASLDRPLISQPDGGALDGVIERDPEGLPGYDYDTGEPLSDFITAGFCLQLLQPAVTDGPFPVHPFFVPTDEPVIDEGFQCRPLPSTSPRPPVVDFVDGDDFTSGQIVADAFVFVNGLPVRGFGDDSPGVDFYDCSYDADGEPLRPTAPGAPPHQRRRQMFAELTVILNRPRSRCSCICRCRFDEVAIADPSAFSMHAA